jgi:phosphoribosyl-AMP cyclohydrolase
MEKGLDWKKGNGLVPIVVQMLKADALALAYSSKKSLEKTAKTMRASITAEARKTWGKAQEIIEIKADCRDALLFMVKQEGNACHTGRRGCFFRGFQEECSVAKKAKAPC